MPNYIDFDEYVDCEIEPDNEATCFVFNGGNFELNICSNGTDVHISFGDSKKPEIEWATDDEESEKYPFTDDGFVDVMKSLAEELKDFCDDED